MQGVAPQFYTVFARQATERIDELIREVQSFSSGTLAWQELRAELELGCHSLMGEARLLDLDVIYEVAASISRPSGRLATPLEPAQLEALLSLLDQLFTYCATCTGPSSKRPTKLIDARRTWLASMDSPQPATSKN